MKLSVLNCRAGKDGQAYHQTLLTMKLLIVFILAAFLETGARGYGQTIHLSLNRVPLETAFNEIKKQTGYRFIYIKEELSLAKPVSIEIKQASLAQVLDICFRDQPFKYQIEDRYVIVTRRVETPIESPPAPAALTITGNVTNEAGEAVAGVTITVKGTNRSTATDEEGNFVMDKLDEGAVLVFTGTNVESFQMTISEQKEIHVQLKTKISKLDEVQVIAYGTSTQRLNTGNVTKIGNKTIGVQPVTNPLSALQGRAAGVYVTTQNGLPGGNISVQIRGRASINSGMDPLYVIDGVPYNSTPLNNGFGSLTTGITGSVSPLNSLNPNDIESIEVLKDADATAIYGSRAANGVILITTKQGKAGKTKTELNLYGGINQASVIPRLLTTEPYLQLRREAFTNDQLTPDASNAPDLMVWDNKAYTDWGKYILGGNAPVWNGQLSFSGGSGQTQFMVSGFYRREGSILPGNQVYEKKGAHVSLQHQNSNKKFSVSFSSSYSQDVNKTLPSSIFSILFLPPNFPIYDSYGNYNWTGVADINPGALLLREARYVTRSLLSNLNLKYEPVKRLTLSANIGYNYSDIDQLMTFPRKSINPLFGTENYAYYGDNRVSLVLIEPQVTYEIRSKQHSIQLLTGGTWQQQVKEGSLVTGRNYSNEKLLSFSGAAGTITATNQYSEYKYASVFTRIRYSYADKYIINLQGRRDGSSKFGPGKQFGNFGSAGIGWLFSNEKWLVNNKVLSYGKLRMSIGYTGNDQIPEYQYLSTYRASSTVYNGSPSLSPSRIANALFGWEGNRKAEIGLETGFFNNKMLVNVVYYHSKSNNQLIEYPLPYLSGPFGYYIANLPATIYNKGWEADFDVQILRRKSFSWKMNGNISVPKNKLAAYPGLANSSYAYTYAVGEDINIRRGLHFTGVDPQSGIPNYEDINKDNQISLPEDYIIMGKLSPSYYGGVEQQLNYKHFELRLFIEFTKKYAIGDALVAGGLSNTYRDALGRWQKPGDITNVPKSSTDPYTAYSYLYYSDAAFYNASYIRFKNLYVAYQLPDGTAKKLGIQQLKIYAEGQNLYTWRKRANLIDPETGYNGITPFRTIAGGIQIIL